MTQVEFKGKTYAIRDLKYKESMVMLQHRKKIADLYKAGDIEAADLETYIMLGESLKLLTGITDDDLKELTGKEAVELSEKIKEATILPLRPEEKLREPLSQTIQP